MPDLITRKTSLPEHIIQFVRFLRTKNFQVSVHEELEILKVLESGIPTSYAYQKSFFKSILVKSRKQFLTFSEIYDDYWTQLARAEDGKIKTEEKETKIPKPSQQKTNLQALKNWLYNKQASEQLEVASYSALEAISKQDFSSFKTNEHRDLQDIIRVIAKRLSNKKSRRDIRSRVEKKIDIKNTIRTSMRNGLDIQTFRFKEKQIKKNNLVLICDVSRSMELYTKFLIEFMYSFHQLSLHIKTFAFSTRLVPLTQTLSDGDFDKVLNNLSEQIPYWSSGTKIAESLTQFKNHYGGKLLNKKSVVLILSDGWDTGDTEDLEGTMKYLKKKSSRLIWINPLAGNPNYQAETKAMKVAMPYIDLFTSAHNLDSLKAITQQF